MSTLTRQTAARAAAPSSQEADTSLSDSSSTRQQLRTLGGYDAQAAALAPVQLQQGAPPPQAGGLQVLSGANTHEYASETTDSAGRGNGHLTKDLVHALERTPDLSAATNELMTGGALANTRSRNVNLQQYTGVTVGGDPSAAEGGTRVVYSIANANYQLRGLADLPNTLNDQNDLATSLVGKGYELGWLSQDRSGAQITGAARRFAANPQLGPGDEAVFHYAGHGLPEGVVGVNFDGRGLGVAAYSTLVGHAQTLTAKGVGVRLILDCCHSGAAGDVVRDELFTSKAAAPASASGGGARTGGGSVRRTAQLGQDLQTLKNSFADQAQGLREAHRANIDLYDENASIAPQGWETLSERQKGAFLYQQYSADMQRLWDDLFAARADELLRQLRAVHPEASWAMHETRSGPGWSEVHHLMDKLDDTLNMVAGLCEWGGDKLKD